MTRKLLLLLSMTTVLMFSGCSNEADNSENFANASTEQEQTADNTKEITTKETTTKEVSSTEPTTTVDKEELAKQYAEECRQILEQFEVEVLATYVGDFKSAGIYNTKGVEYDKATYITLGVKLPEKNHYNYYSGISITGETAISADGNPAPQSSASTAWRSKDYTYLLYVVRVAGEVDVTKAGICLKGDAKGVEVMKSFANNGEAIGFDNAKTKFSAEKDKYGTDSTIIKLQNRHYLITRRYASSSGWSGGTNADISKTTYSYVLMPLENGLNPSLQTSDLKIVSTQTIANTSVDVFANDRGMIDASTLKSQTTINFDFSRTVVETPEDGERYSDEQYDKFAEDKDNLAKSTYVEIDDGDGNTVILKAQ